MRAVNKCWNEVRNKGHFVEVDYDSNCSFKSAYENRPRKRPYKDFP